MGCLEKLTSSQQTEPQAPNQQLIIQQLKMENKKLRNREIAGRENVDNIGESEVQLRNSLFSAQKYVVRACYNEIFVFTSYYLYKAAIHESYRYVHLNVVQYNDFTSPLEHCQIVN